MEALGRLINVAPIVDGAGISLKSAEAVTFICTGADTYTITVADSFAGSYATPGAILTTYYQNTSTNGTAAWTKVSQAASNAVVQAGAYTTAIVVHATSLPDGKTHVKCTSTAAGLVTAILHDLHVQRTPANLPIVGA